MESRGDGFGKGLLLGTLLGGVVGGIVGVILANRLSSPSPTKTVKAPPNGNNLRQNLEEKINQLNETIDQVRDQLAQARAAANEPLPDQSP